MTQLTPRDYITKFEVSSFTVRASAGTIQGSAAPQFRASFSSVARSSATSSGDAAQRELYKASGGTPSLVTSALHCLLLRTAGYCLCPSCGTPQQAQEGNDHAGLALQSLQSLSWILAAPHIADASSLKQTTVCSEMPCRSLAYKPRMPCISVKKQHCVDALLFCCCDTHGYGEHCQCLVISSPVTTFCNTCYALEPAMCFF